MIYQRAINTHFNKLKKIRLYEPYYEHFINNVKYTNHLINQSKCELK